MTETVEGRLREGYRVIRLLTGEADSPWPGALVCDRNGETGVAVSAEVLGADWAGWAAQPSGHVLAPIDILRRPDGHDVLLPVCTERLDEFLRRRAGGAELCAGEAVTVAVSLLRAIAELSAPGSSVSGTWWLTQAGRPVFATESGDAALVDQTVVHLQEIAAGVPGLSAALVDAAEMVAGPRLRARDIERAEAAIFAVAEPLALATTTFGPKRARTRTTHDRADAERAEPAPSSWALVLGRSLDADWADLVSRMTTCVWRALRAPRERRRRPWVLAGGIAAVVLIGGLLWPSGGAGPATAESQVEGAATPSEASAPSPDRDTPDRAEVESENTPADAVSPAASTDLSVIAADLLTARTACGEEPACLTQVLESPDALFPAGVIDFPAGDRTVTMLDEFGGAAVLRAEASGADAAPQLVVIVRTDQNWLLRDVYDVPEQ